MKHESGPKNSIQPRIARYSQSKRKMRLTEIIHHTTKTLETENLLGQERKVCTKKQ